MNPNLCRVDWCNFSYFYVIRIENRAPKWLSLKETGRYSEAVIVRIGVVAVAVAVAVAVVVEYVSHA